MATPRHIYVIRHCEREDDVNRVWYFNSHFTRDNPPLSERGLVQANDLNREFVFYSLKGQLVSDFGFGVFWVFMVLPISLTYRGQTFIFYLIP